MCIYVYMYAVHLDEALHDNHLALSVGEGILQAIAQHDDERQALAELVGAWRCAHMPFKQKNTNTSQNKHEKCMPCL